MSASCSLTAWLRMLRPAQWLKNGILPAAWLFARWDPSQAAAATGWGPFCGVVVAFVSFCLLSSAVYVMNDLNDREADRAHPVKSRRPIASGAVSVHVAAVSAFFLAAGAFALSVLFLPVPFTAVLGGYGVMQVAYTFALKRIPYVDVFLISLGFVLRAIAGAAAIAVRISPWLLLCTFLLSLFLALCKRRHEKILLEGMEGSHRVALVGYSTKLLDMQIAITSSATLVCYSIYTLSEETAMRFGTHSLGWSIPFVAFGLFRYLDLVYRLGSGDRPERVLFTDRVMILTIFGYLATVFSVFFFHL